jgi:hypothetical protein
MLLGPQVIFKRHDGGVDLPATSCGARVSASLAAPR